MTSLRTISLHNTLTRTVDPVGPRSGMVLTVAGLSTLLIGNLEDLAGSRT